MIHLRELARRHAQEHVLRFWDDLSPDERAALEADVRSVDFDLLTRLIEQGEAVHDWAEMARGAEGPPAFRSGDTAGRFSPEEARRRAQDAMPHVAVVLVAGGQGSRLGFPHPKGMYRIGPVSGNSLFQILMESTLAVGRRYGVRVPMFVMTSPATHEETARYFAESERFGMAEEDVTLFCQGTMPAVDASTGRLLLAEKHRLSLSPDGTGGILAAMQRDGVLDTFAARDIRHVYYLQVDNPLAPVCDPEFLGYHLLSGSELSTLVVAKTHPLENLGNVVSIDGKVQILEYSDLSRVARDAPEVAKRTMADGSPVFWAGNLGIHVIDVDFLRRVAGQEDSLPFHVATKKVPYLDEAGQTVRPETENAIKFERFIFDLLPLADEAIVVEADKSTAFAPLKNGRGAEQDTPDSVKAQMIALHRDWLAAAGASVSDAARVEISPLFALDAGQLAQRLPRATKVDEDRYFAP